MIKPKTISSSVFANGINLVVLRGISLVAAVVTNVLLVRFLRADGFGAYTAAMNIFGIFGGINCLGFGAILIREVAKNRKLSCKIFINTLYAGLIISFPVAIAAILFVHVVNYPEIVREGTILLLVALFPAFIIFITEQLFIGLEQVRYFTVASFLRALLETLAILVLLYAGSKTMDLLKLFIVCRFLFAAGLLILIAKLLQCISLKIDWRFILKLMRASLLFALIGITTGFLLKADVLFLAKIAGVYETGIYSAAYKIVFMAGSVINGFIHVLYPVASREYENLSEMQFHRLCRQTFHYLMLILILAIVVTIGFSREMVAILYGREFVKSAAVLKILAFFFIPMCGSAFLGTILAASKYQVYDLFGLLSAMACSVVLNYFLVQAFSFYGSAFALVFSFGVLIAIQGFYINKLVFKFDYINSILKPALVLGLCLAALYGMRVWNGWISGTTAAALCVTLFGMFKLLEWNEFKKIFMKLNPN